MSDQMKKTVRWIYASLLSAMLVVTGVLLMAGCMNVYSIGSRPFTPENISAEFAKIAPIVWITLGLLVIGAFLAIAVPEEKKKLRATVNKKGILDRLMSSLSPSDITGELADKLEKERRFCRILRVAAILLILALSAPALVFSLNFNNFGADYNASVIAACTLILPLSFLGMGVAIAYVFLSAASIDRRIALVKSEMASRRGKACAAAPAQREMRPAILTGIRVAVATVALLFIILGICNGGVSDVLAKAINICTECIGLG